MLFSPDAHSVTLQMHLNPKSWWEMRAKFDWTRIWTAHGWPDGQNTWMYSVIWAISCNQLYLFATEATECTEVVIGNAPATLRLCRPTDRTQPPHLAPRTRHACTI